ncbi:MAG: FG-GAP-like repeat-containing protein, partial [Verrucomicrobiae bacterium]|nr:FG-GAP-like repeat-containing protein [Verrucomicrobiae bacterium]
PALLRGAATWGDYDNDGDLDLLMAGQIGSAATNSVTKLFRNEGNGVFTEVVTPFPGITYCALAFGDMDNDGDLDIAMAGTATNFAPMTRIYRNIGNGVFTNLSVDLLGVAFASVAWGDFDNDGFADLVVSGSTNSSSYNRGAAVTRIYRNNHGVSFTDIGGTLPGVLAQNTTWGDYDNDGDLDLLAGARLVRNNWNIPNTPPSTPTNLSVRILPNDSVLLMWSPSTDVETTNSSGLSYNLRLGTTPGGAQIISPCSDPTNGYRRVPQRGNAGQTNTWQVFNLTNGTYFWSVQAIDTALAGSPFAPESTFKVSRPTISAITNRSAPPNAVVGPIAFTVSDPETAASDLVLAAYSSNTNLVPNENLLLGGSGTNRTLTIIPTTNRSGVTTITILATDENGETGSRSFTLRIERFADIGAGLPAVAGPMLWGDFDNDGDLDLVHADRAYRNLGNNVFSNVGIALVYNEGLGSFGDYDNDGNLDLLAVGANASVVYRGDGCGGFSNINAGLPGAVGMRQCAVWGDYDNDGDADILFAGAPFTCIYRNDGANVFTNIGASLPGAANGGAAWADYDKDGDLDILLAGNGLLRLYRNNGSGTFAEQALGLPLFYQAAVAWGDFDNDGYADFVVAGSTNNSVSGVATRIYRNSTNVAGGGRTFTNLYPVAAQGPVGVWKGAVAWGDYDNDGDLDLLVTGESTNAVALTRLYCNDGGVFADSGHALPGLKNSFAAWGDFDNDGHLDLALSGNLSTGSAMSRIYRNFPAGAPNLPPNPPEGLTAVARGKSVCLAWEGAWDANQTNGLTYNLRIGTSPGACNILSPLSNPDGLRKVAARGNVNEAQIWTITNLPGGTYYWSVQAVDHSFAASAFSAEGSFVITNLPPLVGDRFITIGEDESCVVTLTGTDPDGDPLTFSVLSPPLFGQLIGRPPTLTYAPLSNYFGFDQFHYVANDRTTNSAPATVFIEILPVEDLARTTLSIRPGSPGTMLLLVYGEPWRTYCIEVSEDLVHWRPLTNFICTNLPMVCVDPEAYASSHRFYRAAGLRVVPAFEPGLSKDEMGFSFILRGEPGRNYRIQASTNLIDWITILHVLQTNTLIRVMDADAALFSHRFYRIVAP